MKRTFLVMAAVLATIVASQVPAAAAPAGVLASYEGRMIDLSHSWEGAQVCTEFAIGDVRCFSNEQAASAAMGDFGVSAAEDCKNTWVCLWADADHKGRKLQWNAAGSKKLADWGFRDQASSAALHRIQGGAELVNYRGPLWPDQRSFLRAGGIYSDFRSFDFNDKADEIKVG